LRRPEAATAGAFPNARATRVAARSRDRAREEPGRASGSQTAGPRAGAPTSGTQNRRGASLTIREGPPAPVRDRCSETSRSGRLRHSDGRWTSPRMSRIAGRRSSNSGWRFWRHNASSSPAPDFTWPVGRQPRFELTAGAVAVRCDPYEYEVIEVRRPLTH